MVKRSLLKRLLCLVHHKWAETSRITWTNVLPEAKVNERCARCGERRSIVKVDV